MIRLRLPVPGAPQRIDTRKRNLEKGDSESLLADFLELKILFSLSDFATRMHFFLFNFMRKRVDLHAVRVFLYIFFFF